MVVLRIQGIAGKPKLFQLLKPYGPEEEIALIGSQRLSRPFGLNDLFGSTFGVKTLSRAAFD